jgi:hypothetical protein
VAADLYDCQRVNTGSTHVGYSRMPEVVKAKVADPCPFAGSLEGTFERAHWPTTVCQQTTRHILMPSAPSKYGN